ncbi:hypothetical protein EFM54_04235 [Lentilactobacillus buchneri]|uniref:hypothetical protein n=1 Tax=Lentilactobacillus buchneri TaxID=1581 RepID=UPI0021A61DD3|nr:hypothetical protein [Lentilactobacillus buchneri]MCT2898220.1 hypothetical protein [Lentilactobacillus buchneri]
MHKKFTLAILAAGLLTGSIVSIQSTPSASAKTKITTNKTFKKTSFLINTRKSVYVWNASYTKKLANLKNYPHTNLYSTKRVTIRTSSYYGSYYYVKSANHKIKGYVWHGSLVPGSYIKGGGYRYPTKHVLMSSTPYNKKDWSTSNDIRQTGRVFGVMNATSMKPYLKVPTTSQQKQVINFLKKKNPNVPKMIENRVSRGVRISMMKLYISGQTVELPMIETYPYHYWMDVNSFYPVLQLSKLPNRAKPIRTYSDAKTVTTVFGSRTYDFEDPTAQSTSNMEEGPITKVYGNGYGPNHDLSLVDCRDRLRYVTTKNIISISNNQPTLRDGIWYVAPSYQFVSIGGHEQKLRNLIDTSKSTDYRYVTPNGFTQYKYENNSWNPKFGLSFDFQKNGDVKVTIHQLSGTLNHPKTVGDPQTIATLTGANADAEMMTYLNHSAGWYDQYLQ